MMRICCGVLMLIFLLGCSSSRSSQALWQPVFQTQQTSCLMGLPSTLPLHQSIVTGCDPALWVISQQYTSALEEPCVIVTSGAETQRWCFNQNWRQLPSVLAHE